MDDRSPQQSGHPDRADRTARAARGDRLDHRRGWIRDLVLALALFAVLLVVPLGHAWTRAGDVRSRANLSLTDDTGGVALFPGTSPLSPGARQASCLVVAAGGTAPGDTVTFAAEAVAGPLAPWVQVEVEVGTGGGLGSCVGFSGSPIFTGTLAQLGAVPDDGVATGWSPSTIGSRSFRLTVDVPNDPAALGLTATATFTWRLVAVSSRPTPTPSPSPSPTDSLADSPTPAGPPPSSPTTTDPGEGGDGGGQPGAAVPASTTTPSGPALTTGEAGDVDLWSGQAGPWRTPRTRTAKSTPHRADLTLESSVPQRVARTLASVIRDPSPLLWPACVAVLFLLLQHRLDLRDPKLTAAWRTGRDLTLRFPTRYDSGGPR